MGEIDHIVPSVEKCVGEVECTTSQPGQALIASIRGWEGIEHIPSERREVASSGKFPSGSDVLTS